MIAISKHEVADQLCVQQAFLEDEDFAGERAVGRELEGFELRTFDELSEAVNVDLKSIFN